MNNVLYLVVVFILVALVYLLLLPIMIIASIMECLNALVKTFLSLNLTYFVGIKKSFSKDEEKRRTIDI